MMRSVFLIILATMVIFSGCKTFEPEPVTPLSVTIPDRFSIDKGSSEAIESWWMSFGSDELNSLIQDAVDNNFDLKIYKAKIAQAKANVEKQGASFFPDLGFSLGGQKKATQVKKTYGKSAAYDGSHSWDGSLSGSYTADVWGEAQAGKQSRVLDLEAAGQDLRNATHELTADIAETWIDIIAVRNKKSILDQQININKTLLKLQKLRFANGKAKALDVSQQREALAEASSQVPLLEKQERLLLNTLAFLSGKTAADQLQLDTQTLPDPLPLPRVGIPSALLENRPDIKAAGMRLSSAQWEIAAAKADVLPSFKLTAQALFSSGKLDLLFQNWVATLAGSIAGPIFDGGLKKAEIERVKAAAQEQLNLYARSVAKAIIEVEDSLVSIQKQEDYIRLLEEELDVVRLTLKEARVQYENGQSSYLSYLIAWTSIERLERQLIGERASLIKDRIALYRALGWKPVL
ncbi:MAG: efflux transporter outer membrane subunit [Proteobacteria bacterium]|nr:efflux transporter outer membrane subunit [Pseudomonadota bacterium]MBU1584991.1 efflux transporter outer membrane subunit [Pseudomonadota bacterium]MBU2454438.1 efflux transporter outer membrane subunit [Pseudomonadota bacterium]MBU2631647.1 efflux transporter outer membrane subunit [Pseudomonadota bacterium]